VAGVLASFLWLDRGFTIGLALGGGLALFNYRWLQSSLHGVLAAGDGKTPPGTMLKFVLRWGFIAIVGLVAHRTGFVDARAILIGLLAPAVAIIIEAAHHGLSLLRAPDGER
jgi:hypothetical protein